MTAPHHGKPTVVLTHLYHHMEALADHLRAGGVEVVRIPAVPPGTTVPWTAERIERFVAGADALVGLFHGMRLERDVLAAGTRLRVVTSPIIGTEHIDVDACTDLGIVVGFGATPENTEGMAEAIVMLIAALRKHLPGKIAEVRAGGWSVPDVGRMVRGSTVGLIGFGAIGRATARHLQGWDCTVLIADPYVAASTAREHGAELVELDTLLSRSDVVSVGVPLSAATRSLIGQRELALMPAGSYLINTARGGTVDEAALADALDRGHLAGAAIDTWQDEPTSSPLRNHSRVIATAHNVGHSEELYRGHPIAAAENTLRALRGDEPLYVRNPEVLPAWHARIRRLDASLVDHEPR